MADTRRIICLGNRDAAQYRRNPQPPGNIPLDKLEIWATMVCDLNIDDLPMVGEFVKDSDGNPSYQVTADHRRAMLIERIEIPVIDHYKTGQKLCTTIKIGADSSLLQAVDECLKVWRGNKAMRQPGHAADGATPAWIAGTHPGIVAILADELGIAEIREYDPKLDPN